MLKNQQNMEVAASAAASKLDTEALAAEVLKSIGGSLEVRIRAGLSKDMGILRHNGVPYVWELRWHIVDKDVDFLLDIWEVRAVIRNGRPRADRKPRLIKVASKQFSAEV